jgi:hypothetical protein
MPCQAGDCSIKNLGLYIVGYSNMYNITGNPVPITKASKATKAY